MPNFYDLCLRKKSKEFKDLAEELGWNKASYEVNTVFLDADDWGELKRKINQKREKADVLVFKGGDENLNRKAAGDTRVDILLHPEKNRKDSGINHVIAKEAAENNVAIGLDFKQLNTSKKIRSHILNHWRRNLMLCEKYNAPYLITTRAGSKYELRSPKDLKSIVRSLGHHGIKSISKNPEKILDRAEKAKKNEYIRPGMEKAGDKK